MQGLGLENNCYYHPNEGAVTNCEHCGKPICAECRTIYRGDFMLGCPDKVFCFQCKECRKKVDRTNDLFMYGFLFFGFIFCLFGYIVTSLLFRAT